jgi:hypothetical protein
MSGVATSGQTAKTPAASSSAITAEPAAGEFSVEQANRVDLALAQIAKKKRLTPLLRKITFSQDELNSYLNIIYTKQYAPQIKYIHMKLDKNNIVNGVLSIKLDAREYAQVPEFLRNINVDVSGKIESENSRMRYLFESLKINGANFSPNLLDQAFGAAQGNTKNKKSLFDWFDLLPGLKKLAVDTNQITIFY